MSGYGTVGDTVYLGALEEVSGTTLTKYFAAAGLPTAERVGTGGALSYLASDGLGSVSEAVDGSGNVTFQQLFTPYANSRYSSGASPTSYAFTGQRYDANTGFMYFHARYYNFADQQFASADTVQDGLNRYAYVHGNPTTATDPSGHCLADEDYRSGCYPGTGGPSGSTGGGLKPPPSTPKTPPPPLSCYGVNCDDGTTTSNGCSGGCQAVMDTSIFGSGTIDWGRVFDALKQVGLGVLAVLGVASIIIGGCSLWPPACLGWIIGAGGPLAQAHHYLLDGLDKLAQALGAAPFVLLVVRSVKIYDDIATMATTVAGIGVIVKDAAVLIRGAKSLLDLLVAVAKDGYKGIFSDVGKDVPDAVATLFDIRGLRQDGDDWMSAWNSMWVNTPNPPAVPVPGPSK